MQIYHGQKPSPLFNSPFEEVGESPPLELLPLPTELERLHALGICDEYGEVSSAYASVPLQPLNLKEALTIFQEVFQKRESLLDDYPLHIDMGHVVASVTKWMSSNGDNSFHPHLGRAFIRHLLFNLLPHYATRQFKFLGIDAPRNEGVIHSCTSTLVAIEGVESSLERIMNVALSFLARSARLNNPFFPGRISKKMVQNQLIEGEIFQEKTVKFGSKSKIQERGFVHLRLRERPETVKRAMDVSLSNQWRSKTFTANSLYISLQDILGLDWAQQYNLNDLKCRCSPQALNGSPLQAFLDSFFGHIAGEGDWFELITLYAGGFTSREKEPLLAQRRFEAYYSSSLVNEDPAKLAERIQEELEKTYPNDPEFHLFFLLNAAMFLFENEMETEAEILLEKGVGSLTLNTHSAPALVLLVSLMKEEKIPFALLLSFLQVVSFMHYISDESGGEYGASVKSEERRRNVMLLRLGDYILRMPYQTSQPFFDLYSQLARDPLVENKLLQLFMLMRPTGLTISPMRMVSLRSENVSIHLIADLFLQTPSYLLNGIGLALKLSINDKLPSVDKIADILKALDVHYAGVEERHPLQFFICEVVESCIGEFSISKQQEFIIVNNRFEFLDSKEMEHKEKKRFRGVIDLASHFIGDLEQLNTCCWPYLYRVAAEVNMTMDLRLLWDTHVSHYVLSSRTDQHLTFNTLLFGLKRCASEGNEEASIAICNYFQSYYDQKIDNSLLIDFSISDLLIFVTETLRHIQSDRKWLEPLSTMVKLLFTYFAKAQNAFFENETHVLGSNAIESKYVEYHIALSLEYFDILFADSNTNRILTMCNLIGFENLYFPTKYVGRLLNLMCKKEMLDRVNYVLDPYRQVNYVIKGISVDQEQWHFIPSIDYTKVIPFLHQYLSPERIAGTLIIWRQYFDSISNSTPAAKKEERVIDYGLSFIEYALKLDTNCHDALLLNVFNDFLVKTKNPFWKKYSETTLKYFALLVRHMLHIKDPSVSGHFSDVILIVISHLSKFINANQLLNENHELFALLPHAIITTFSYDREKFAYYAESYWSLHSLLGRCSIKKGEGKKFTYEIGFLSPSSYKRKKQFLELLVEAIDAGRGAEEKGELIKVAGTFHAKLKREIEDVPELITKRGEELRILYKQIEKAFDLREHFDILEKEIEKILLEIPSKMVKEERIELWKRSGYLLANLKKESSKYAELYQEKRDALVNLDRKVKEAFSLLK